MQSCAACCRNVSVGRRLGYHVKSNRLQLRTVVSLVTTKYLAPVCPLKRFSLPHVGVLPQSSTSFYSMKASPPVDVNSKRTGSNLKFYVNYGLPWGITVHEVHDYFKKFGNVESVILAPADYDKPHQDDRAEVVFAEGSDVTSLININHRIGKMKVIISTEGKDAYKVFYRKKERMINISGVTDDTTVDDVHHHFHQIGHVEKVSNLRGGCGFVHFRNIESAVSADRQGFHKIGNSLVKVSLLAIFNKNNTIPASSTEVTRFSSEADDETISVLQKEIKAHKEKVWKQEEYIWSLTEKMHGYQKNMINLFRDVIKKNDQRIATLESRVAVLPQSSTSLNNQTPPSTATSSAMTRNKAETNAEKSLQTSQIKLKQQ